MKRRAFLSAVAMVGLAGCGGGNGNGDSNGAAADATPEGTPTPESTSEPTPTPVSEPDPLSFSGSGQAVTDSFDVQGGFTGFAFEHDGESNFQVKLLDASTGDRVDLLANEIGSWQAKFPRHVPAGEYLLDVTADGSWQATVTQPRPGHADVIEPPLSFEGSYPDYEGPIEFPGLVTIAGEYSGESNFQVFVRNIDGEVADLTFNEIGAFEGKTTFSGEGFGWINVRATGDWSIRVE
jgi:hypothetical protein